MKAVTRRGKRTLTLRAAYDGYYPKDELGKDARRTFDASLKAWERLTPNPDVTMVTNETVAEFRADCLEAGYRPASVNSIWSRLRAIFRRIGPPVTRNPWGLGLIDRIPAMRPVREVHRRPYRIPLEDLDAVYAAADQAAYPRVVPASDWWRSLLCVAYTTGLRRGDIFNLKWSQVDFRERTLDFTARKTGKADVWPLHPVAIAHLERLHPGVDDAPVFAGNCSVGSRFYRRFHALQKAAGVKRLFTLHDIRRTAASEIERVKSGLAPEFLQHAPRNVTERYYLNQYEELSEALQEMRLARGFRVGPKNAQRELEKLRRRRSQQLAKNPAWSTKPAASDWAFWPGGFTFRGMDYRLEWSSRLRLLELLATSERAVAWEQAAEVLGNPQGGDSRTRVRVHVSGLRQQLRDLFGLPDSVDPIRCVSRGDGGAWTLSIP